MFGQTHSTVQDTTIRTTPADAIALHHREPHLARRGVRRRALVREAGLMVALKARNPPGDGRAGDPQKLADTALTPALRIEGDDLPAGLGPLGIAVGVEQRPGGGRGRGEAVPEALRRLPSHAMHGGMKNDPSQCAGAETRIESFEPLEFVHHGVRHPELAARGADVQGVGHEAEHALLVKKAFEATHGFRMGPGFLRPLRRRALRVKEQRADEFIPLLGGVAERELEIVRLCMRSHHGSLPAGAPGHTIPGPHTHGTSQATPSRGPWYRRRCDSGRR